MKAAAGFAYRRRRTPLAATIAAGTKVCVGAPHARFAPFTRALAEVPARLPFVRAIELEAYDTAEAGAALLATVSLATEDYDARRALTTQLGRIARQHSVDLPVDVRFVTT